MIAIYNKLNIMLSQVMIAATNGVGQQKANRLTGEWNKNKFRPILSDRLTDSIYFENKLHWSLSNMFAFPDKYMLYESAVKIVIMCSQKSGHNFDYYIICG